MWSVLAWMRSVAERYMKTRQTAMRKVAPRMPQALKVKGRPRTPTPSVAFTSWKTELASYAFDVEEDESVCLDSGSDKEHDLLRYH